MDSKEREESASGGFVFAAMKSCLDNGGVVCGCVWDENMKAVHIITDKEGDLQRMQSSKYVQSEIGRCYSEVKAYLKRGRKVIFCGTPCQTVGLKSFLGRVDATNLISICVICHGTPSPLAWEKWKQAQDHKYKGKLEYVNMRDKHKKGYATTCCKYVYDVNGTKKIVERAAYIADPYVFLFSDSLYLRNSCYHCQYKADGNGADIIAGDFHASINEAGKWGCSSVFAMTPKGEDYITDPKTEKSNRTVSIPDFLCEELQEYLAMLYGFKDDDRMFQITKSFLHHEMIRGSEKAGVKRIRIHDIRYQNLNKIQTF